MEKREAQNAPKAIGPYSHVIITGNLVFTSGQIPINPQTGEMETEIKAQTKQAITNLSEVLKACDTSLSRVIKTTVFIKDMNDFNDINEVYADFFTEPYPARSCVQVAKLPKDALIEIEAVAEI